MKQYATWICDRCNAIFTFDADFSPLRCPDCLSPKQHLHHIDDADRTKDDMKSVDDGKKLQ